MSAALVAGLATASAQTVAADSVMQHVNGKRLSVGGYGEVAMSRNFYSDAGKRYSNATAYKNAPDHGRFDIPHAVIYLGYDFGKGWSMGTEIEFEHGGTGQSIEYEAEEAIEYEQEVEKGGEVELEQFWIQKSFGRWANIKAGHIVVPVGLTNAYHEPLNFFTVYRPEGENTILPCTWHQTGISFWGKSGKFRYEAQFLAGLNAYRFSRSNWIQGGAKSPYEFEVANKYAVAARVDNYSIPGLRIGLSGYYGKAMGNTTPQDTQHKNIKGNVYVGAFDFTYNKYNWKIRDNVDYGYVAMLQPLPALYILVRLTSSLMNQAAANTSAVMPSLPWWKQAMMSSLRFPSCVKTTRSCMCSVISSITIHPFTIPPPSGPTAKLWQQVSTTSLSHKSV